MSLVKDIITILQCIVLATILGCNITNASEDFENNTKSERRYLIKDESYFNMTSPANWVLEHEFDPFLKEYKMVASSKGGEQFKMRMMLSLHKTDSKMLVDSDQKMELLNQDSARSAAANGAEDIELVVLKGAHNRGFGYFANYPDEEDELMLTGSIQTDNLFVTFLATANLDSEASLKIAMEMIQSIKLDESAHGD